MKAIKEFNREAFFEFQTEHEIYCEKEQFELTRYFAGQQITITDITNALKTGATCESYTIGLPHYARNDRISICQIYFEFDYDLKKLWSFLQNLDFNSKDALYGGRQLNITINGVEYEIHKRHEEQGVRTFSPFTIHRLKPLKEQPKKWTVRHAIRAIVNRQYSQLKCKGQYTDDYAFDASIDYGRGEIKNNIAFAKQIIENPSGWWANDYEKNGKVSICCHSFDSNEFTFDLNGAQK